MTQARGLFGNTLAQSASVITGLVFSLILAPIMLSRLGLAEFGVWAVTGALAQYARLLDLGVSSSLIRFVALHDAGSDRRGVEETLGVGLVMVAILGSITILTAFFSAPIVSDALGVLGPDEMRIVLLSSAGILVLNLLGGVISSVPLGLRRMTPPNVAGTLGNVVNFAASVAVLAVSTELTHYAVANLAAAFAGVGFSVAALAYVWSAPYFSRATVPRAREIVAFGLRSQVMVAAQLINVQTDKVVIAVVLGPKAAGAYELANRAVLGVRALANLSLSAMIPTATAAIVQHGRGVLRGFYTRYSLNSLAIGLPMYGALAVSAPYLFMAWLGEVPADSTMVLVLLSIGFGVSMFGGVPMTLAISDGHPGLVAQNSAVLIFINVAGTIALAPILGLWGVLAATVVAQLISKALFLSQFHRRYRLSASDFASATLRPTFLSLLAALPFALWYLLDAPDPTSRGPALLGFIATAGAYGTICWIAASRQHLLPEKLDLGWLVGRLVEKMRRMA